MHLENKGKGVGGSEVLDANGVWMLFPQGAYLIQRKQSKMVQQYWTREEKQAFPQSISDRLTNTVFLKYNMVFSNNTCKK